MTELIISRGDTFPRSFLDTYRANRATEQFYSDLTSSKSDELVLQNSADIQVSEEIHHGHSENLLDVTSSLPPSTPKEDFLDKAELTLPKSHRRRVPVYDRVDPEDSIRDIVTENDFYRFVLFKKHYDKYLHLSQKYEEARNIAYYLEEKYHEVKMERDDLIQQRDQLTKRLESNESLLREKEDEVFLQFERVVYLEEQCDKLKAEKDKCHEQKELIEKERDKALRILQEQARESEYNRRKLERARQEVVHHMTKIKNEKECLERENDQLKEALEAERKGMGRYLIQVQRRRAINNLDYIEKVFAVRSGGVMGVVVKSPNDEGKPMNFRMEDHGPVLSIKFSLDHKVLAVQRTNNSVEFMNFDGNTIDSEYSQCCKKNSNVLGFVWSHINEVALITDHGIELYLVIPEKKSLKHLKTTSVTVQWFVWCSLNKIALLASAHGSVLQPVLFKQGSISKLLKVDTEPGRMALERDVTLATLYGTPAVLILRHQSGPHTAEVHVHTLNGPGQAPVKSHVLKLGLSGRFAINVVDDLILVHHQASRSSQIFDIALPGESDGNIRYHTTIAPARSFRPTSLALPGLVEPQTHVCELYSPNWVVFQPNIVIDAKLGCLWHIKLCLPELCSQISDLSICTQVALKRTNGKPVLLKYLLEIIKQAQPPLEKLQTSFNHINYVYRDWLQALELQSLSAAPLCSIKYTTPPRVVIYQDDIYSEIFDKLDPVTDLRKIEWLLISYMTSLSEVCLPTQHNLNELLITNLAQQKKFTALQQLLQYGVISNSKPLACLLLSLGNMHPSTSQMALDMLARIDAKEEIQEILLSEGQILAALKIAEDSANPRKFLTAANATSDNSLLHSVLIHFQNNPHYAAAFKKDERLMNFVQQYNCIFSDK